MKKAPIYIILSAVLLLAAPGQSVCRSVVNPHVSTDKSVDCSTVDRILEDLITEGMTDEQKVLAVFHWIRRVLYHGDGPAELAFDFHKMVHVLGNGSCLRQTTPLALLLSRLGFESQSWMHDGHHMIQVKYGNHWHCLDPHMNFLAYDRSAPRKIASIDQLRSDSTLAWSAREENRAGPGYLLCGDPPGFFTGGGTWVNEGGWPQVKVEEPFGAIILRRGESYMRSWMPGPHYYKNAWKFDYGAYHTCGPGDEKDIVNWPLYEPHAAVVNNIKAYRHWGAGRLQYSPEVKSDHYLDGVVSRDNLTHEEARGLVALDPQKQAEVVFSVNCPYVITAGALVLETGGEGLVQAAVSADRGEGWQPVELSRVGKYLTGKFVEEVNGTWEGYLLRLTIEGGAWVSLFAIESHFQLNPYSLPYLVPGLNTVRVEGEKFGSPLTLEWRYAEGPDWKEAKTAKHTFSAPGEFAIQVAGQKYPRNVSITLSIAQ
jgi:hypothetical protein